MISIGIVEDDEKIRKGIQSYLDSQEEFVCKNCFGSVEEISKPGSHRSAGCSHYGSWPSGYVWH